MNNYCIKSTLKKMFFFVVYILFNCFITRMFIEENSFVLLFIFNLIFLVLLLFYTFWKEKSILFFKRRSVFKNVVLSMFSVYLFRVIIDPFYKDFGKDVVIAFKLNIGNFTHDVFYILMILIVGSMTEELLFRGLILEKFNSRFKTIISVFCSSILYSISHFYYLFIITDSNFEVWKFFDLFLLGIVLSILSIRYGLIYAIAAHFFYNLILFLIDFDIVNLFILDYIDNNYYVWYFTVVCFLSFPFLLKIKNIVSK